jgi:uncharacterized protein YabE (DUF348 family)
MHAVFLLQSFRPARYPKTAGFREIAGLTSSFFKKYPLIGWLIAVLALAGILYLYGAHPFAVFVDGEPFGEGRSFSRTVDEALAEMGFVLHPEDRVYPEPAAVLTRHARIDIQRAFPVHVIADGKIAIIWTAAVAVADFLEKKGFAPGPYDRIEPPGLEKVYPLAEIRIVRVTKAYETRQSELPFAEVNRENPLVDRGLSSVISPGRPGLREELLEITFEDGREICREVVDAVVLANPENRVVEYGSNTRLAREGLVLEFDRVLIMTATAYCPGTPGSGCPVINDQGHTYCTHSENDGFTFTGKRAVQGLGTLFSPHLVAVDPKVIPLHSLLYIEEIPGIGKIGFALAEDIGGAIKGNIIDLLYDRHSDVVKFGLRRGVRVYVLKR